jgi:lysyl-tRNA synthetase class 2
MNALDIDLYLRISLELYQKRLLVGGYEKVFEIGRIFRNEGIDREHLQDYTQMEFYWAYVNYERGMELVERMYKHVIQETLGTTRHMWNDTEIDWGRPWERIDYYEAFQKYTGINLSAATELSLKEYAENQGLDTAKHPGRGRLIDVIYKKMVRPHFVEPAFLILPPADVSPLAKRWSGDPNRAERFQPVAGASELGNGYSELNDPLDQRARFEEQEALRKAGDTEAQRMDDDFVEALEYGMPPACGFGVSERLFSFIVGKPIRETTLFPLMRPRKEL